MTILLTEEEQKIADASAVAIVEIPAEQQMDAFERVTQLYISELLLMCPGMTRETLLHNTTNFCRAVIRRVRDLAMGGNTIGHA
jgi:hypothetical protein